MELPLPFLTLTDECGRAGLFQSWYGHRRSTIVARGGAVKSGRMIEGERDKEREVVFCLK